ncbi:MAG: tryptophan 2,3-dioxygenase [Acidobacteria bacterium]|nr:tryptophan 2,3-dioxygenase [Acidobacteriota bacterium]
MDRAVTYNSYLKVDELLALQQPRSEGPEHDELLFIVIHQVYELWFKEILHELDHVRALLDVNDAHRAQHTMKRVLTILKVLVAQLDILETMTPLEFQSFRLRLEQASGFQSDQFRQLEFVLGRRSEQALDRFPAGSRARAALVIRLREPSLWGSFLAYLAREGYRVPAELLSAEPSDPIVASPALQQLLVDVYKTDAKNSEMCERLVDLDEGVQEWRYRHMKMVERTIGTHAGTGGSAGAAYLRTTISPAFPDLWAIRSQL